MAVKIVLKRERGSIDKNRDATITREYRIEVPEPIDVEELFSTYVYGQTADTTTGMTLPEPYQSISTNSYYLCSDIEASGDSQKNCVWDITAKFNSLLSENNPNDPTDDPPNITFGHQKYRIETGAAYSYGIKEVASDGSFGTVTVPLKKEEDGRIYPVCNSLGYMFEDGIIMAKSNPVITIQRNEKSTFFDPNGIKDYIETLNYNAITIAGMTIYAGEGKMVDISANNQYYRDEENNLKEYYNVTYKIEVDREGHFEKILNAGKICLDTSGKRRALVEGDDFIEIDKYQEDSDDSGAAIESTKGTGGTKTIVKVPVKLKLNGLPIKDQSAASATDSFPIRSQESVWVYYQAHPAIDWTPLGLPARKDGFV